MARPRNQYPTLKFHKKSGQWCLYRDNKRITLGTDRQAAEERRLRLLAEWSGQPVDPMPAGSLTVAEALDLYYADMEARQSDPRKLSRIGVAIAVAVEKHGSKLAKDFRGRALKDVRCLLVHKKHKRTERLLSRRYINHLIDALVLAFRWLAAHEYVPSENVAFLREMSKELAETEGEESPIIAAVDDAIVEKTLPHCLPTVAAMIKVQQATGMRPGELCSMCREELSTKPGEQIPIAGMDKSVSAIAFHGELIWLYCPSRHKNLHRRKPRVIAIGTEAQTLLRPFLEYTGEIFRNESGRPYTPATYGSAVARAIRAAGGIQHWSPNQLRKAAAKRIDGVFGKDGADMAAAMLGHSASRQALDSYIAEQIEKAVKGAAKAG